jgi:phospholipid/cholesterol/gamma-HCH transport system permease protein
MALAVTIGVEYFKYWCDLLADSYAAERSASMFLETDRTGDTLALRLTDEWSIGHAAAFEAALAEVSTDGVRRVRIDCTRVKRLDLSAAWLVRNWLQALASKNVAVEFAGKQPAHFDFIDDLAKDADQTSDAAQTDAGSLAASMRAIGKFSVEMSYRTRIALEFYGRILVIGGSSLRHPRRLRAASIVRHVYETGIQAVPIVALIAFLITLVIAYIGAQQLRDFGAEIFTVDLVTVGVLREMGVLLTAIIVAGRSGSAFAAEIGVMQLNDEVDALKSIGTDPYEVLVLPRVLGLIIALPLLVILADAMGLAGGALLCQWLLDISLPQFVVRMQDALAPTTFWAGFIKAPVFAFLIAMTGTYRGMQVRDSSRELGRLTTLAVVQSIFLVILANAVFAVLYLQLDF